MLEKAILFALKAHSGQKDKAGKNYILHTLRVMLCFEKEQQQIVAVLHDVLEDSEMTEQDLKKAGFSQQIIEAVVCLTKKEGECYFNYIQRVKQNDVARVVKLADLEDNMNLKRIQNVTQKDIQRVEKYKKAKEMLEK
ncbi:hypothetical protein [Clostridium sp. MD294]|uniref:hypothetical protein n=1 Tax=Clostridium sp. MD294 TaxID=97138 RepID=UPI0002C97760|nr:hypothetical protein [Clostridium sp. MD294]USF29868.1 hypothetical protein C820_001276 [Clostridium sp. MD294]